MANENRLIYADPVYEELRKSYEELKSIRDTLTQHEDIQICNGQLVVFQEALWYIKNAPTVDAVEVVHGEWSTIEDDYCGLVALHCSVCNQEWWFEDDAPIKHYHYCPNCGAKMDGDSNG